MIKASFLAACTFLAAALTSHAQNALTSDPAPDKSAPAAMQAFQLPSHGAQLNALAYIAPGPGPHPVIILLHGFPGNEKNLDVAQTMRRSGWDVLYFNYRGSWGSPGNFSFAHSIEDAQAAVAYLRDPANAAKLRADPARIVLLGHSMGGMIANYVAAHDPAILAVGLISAADMAGRAAPPPSAGPEAIKHIQSAVSAGLAHEGMAPLAGCTPDSLAAELVAHSSDWALAASATSLANRPVLIITSDDGLAAPAHVLFLALRAAGNQQASEVHMPTDHVYSDRRIELQEAILKGLAPLKRP